MWRVFGFNQQGVRQDLRFREFTGQSLRRIIEDPVTLGGSILGWPEGPTEYLDKAVPTWLRPDDVVDIVGGAADNLITAALHPTSSVFQRIQVGPPATAALDTELAASIWIDESIVFIDKPADVRDIKLLYTAEADDFERSSLIEFNERYTAEAYLEWYLALGSNTGVAIGDALLEGAGRVKGLTLRVGGGIGRMVARVVNVLSKMATRETTDPFRLRRQRRLEDAARELAERVPETTNWARASRARVSQDPQLADAAAPVELTVLVHGTLSAGMRMTAALFPSSAVVQPLVVRYEHDTFHTIHGNARELAELVSGMYNQPGLLVGANTLGRIERVLFVAHSRGGLVSVEAAKRLVSGTDLPQRIPASAIQVLSYGTPHAGTPLVRAASTAGGFVRCFASVASKMAAPVFGPDPSGWVLGFALRFVRVPNGIAAMDPDSDYIRNRKSESFDFDIMAWGARTSSTAGMWPAVKAGFLTEIMRGDSDGVVPTASTVAGQVHDAGILDECSHFEYFERREIRNDLLARIGRGCP